MPVTLTDLRSMTLLQIITIPGGDIDRLSREALIELNNANRCIRRLRNARYLQRIARAREKACSVVDHDERGGV